MELAFTDEQLALRDTVRDLLTRECPSSVVRAAWSNATGRTDRAWQRLGEIGALSVLGPQPDGLGLGFVDLVLVLEEAGRAALPEPIVEHAAVAAPLVDLDGRTATAAAPDAPAVLDADTADVLLLVHDGELHAVPADRVGLTLRPAVDASRRMFEVDWTPTGETRIDADVGAAFDRGALGTAAVLVGLAQHLLDTTVDYASDRRQFGAPIGSFQAVKHHLADVAIALEFARPLVHRAAWSLDTDQPDAAIHVSMAKARAGDAAELAARHALQCHGAIGYSFEYDLHLWMKRVWALSGAWGDARWHRARVSRAILVPDTTVDRGATR